MKPTDPCPCGGTQKSSGWAKAMYPPINHYRCAQCGYDRWYRSGEHIARYDGTGPEVPV